MSQPIQQKHIIYIGLESEFYAQISEKNNKKIAKTTIFAQKQRKCFQPAFASCLFRKKKSRHIECRDFNKLAVFFSFLFCGS